MKLNRGSWFWFSVLVSIQDRQGKWFELSVLWGVKRFDNRLCLWIS